MPKPTSYNKDFVKKINHKYNIEHGMRIINLAEVEIINKAQQNEKAVISSPYYSINTSEVINEKVIEGSNMNTTFGLLNRLPGISISGQEVKYKQSKPLAIIDNIPVDDFDYSVLYIAVQVSTKKRKNKF